MSNWFTDAAGKGISTIGTIGSAVSTALGGPDLEFGLSEAVAGKDSPYSAPAATSGQAGYPMYTLNGVQYDSNGDPVKQVNSNPQQDFSAKGYGTNTQQTVDPYAKYGGVENYNSMVNQLNTGKANALSGAGATMDAALRGGQSTILDYIQNAKQQQQGIDQKRANAQFSLQEGKGDIMDMVGRGIRSGGVMLANKNAGSSGAAGQIARAYGELGNRETRDVGNQYALENQGIDLEQNQLATGFDTQKRKIDEFKIGQAEEIAGTARNALAALEAQRVGASLPELFQIDQEVQAIKQQTLAKLGELDTLLASERSKINPMGQQDVFAKANEMRTAGTGGPQMFNFNTDAAQMQMNGPSVAGSQLPIYSNLALNRRREV